MGGIITKIKINGSLKNITENEIINFKTLAIKENNKYKYIIEKDKYILKVISDKKIILNRENNEIKSTMYFDLNKKTSSEYTLKENDITLEIDILTNKLEITEKSITIIYTVIDSNISYEYNIEMSE